MIARALVTLTGTTLLGIAVGAVLGRLIGTHLPRIYFADFYGARTNLEAVEIGTAYGAINGSILGVVIGGLALLYDLGRRFLENRERKPPADG